MNTDQLVSAENIAYKINDNKLFHNISFILEKGKALHICGSNGSGKSTLIRIILGITTQTKGDISIFSEKKICGEQWQAIYPGPGESLGSKPTKVTHYKLIFKRSR